MYLGIPHLIKHLMKLKLKLSFSFSCFNDLVMYMYPHEWANQFEELIKNKKKVKGKFVLFVSIPIIFLLSIIIMSIVWSKSSSSEEKQQGK